MTAFGVVFRLFAVKNLLNAGASPDCSNEDGLTVLHQVPLFFWDMHHLSPLQQLIFLSNIPWMEI